MPDILGIKLLINGREYYANTLEIKNGYIYTMHVTDELPKNIEHVAIQIQT